MKLNLIEINLVQINGVKNVQMQCQNVNFVIILLYVCHVYFKILTKIFYHTIIILVQKLVEVLFRIS